MQPKDPLEVKTEFQELSNTNSCKASVYHFILACKKELEFREDQLFTITELYKDDTNGFVKVIKTVSLVLDLIEEEGLMIIPRRPSLRYSDPDRTSDAPIGNREKVVSELLETERKYVADLEILQNYMRQLRQANIVSLETIRNLFANLNTLVDFQRRFLIGVEANAQLPPSEQRFGALFVQMEENFSVYEPFCANYSSASELAVQETSSLMKLSHVLEPAYALPALLIKPIQRICKYPLLLKELIKYTESSSYDYYNELLEGCEAIKRVTDKVNEERRKEENLATVSELEQRVEDWKGHSVDSFGALLLSDKFVMATNDVERELHVFLFEKILLCCKESGSTKKRSAGAAQLAQMMRSSMKSGSSSTTPKKPALQLKGRIFITSVTGVINNSKNGQNALKVFWRDVEMESFALRCRNEEQLKLWKSTLSKLVEESTKEKEASSLNISLAGSRNQRSTNSAPNLDSNAVMLDLQRGIGSDRPVPRRALTAGPGTYQNTFVRKPEQKRRDDDAASFINASDDEEDDEEEGGEVDPSWASRGRIPRGSSANIFGGRPPAKSYASESDIRSRIDEADTQSSYPYPSNLPGMSLPPLPRGNNVSYQNKSNVYPTSPPPSTPTSPSNSRERQGEDTTHLSDTIARYMKVTTDGGYSETPPNGPPTGSLPAPPRRQSHRISASPTLHYPHTNFPPNAPPTNPLPKFPSMGSRSTSSPNIQSPTTSPPPPVPRLPTNPNQYVRSDDVLRNLPSGQGQGPPPVRSPHRHSSSFPNNTSGTQLQYPQTNFATPGTKRVPSPRTVSASYSSSPTSGVLRPANVKIKVSYIDDIFIVVVPSDIGYRDLMDRLERKIQFSGGPERRNPDSPPLRVRYHDEDGDYITINSDDDVMMAFETTIDKGNLVNLFVS